MSKIYLESGWVNWDYICEQPETIKAVVGGRGVGKTYGIFKKLINERKRFIYLRRLKSQIDQCSKIEGSPFKRLNADLGTDIKPFSSNGITVYRYESKTGDIAAVGVALSVVANIRGIDLSDYDYIVFDEFIANIGEHPIKNEYAAFLNFYETVNRNRELEGKAPVQCLMLANANTVVNPYFSAWHLMRTVVKMISGKQMVYRRKELLLIMLVDSPISKRKKETALYQTAGDDYNIMALDNAFRIDQTKIKSEPLREYYHVVSIGELGIYKHKAERKYYVSSTTAPAPYYDSFGISLKMFVSDFYMLRVHYLVNKCVWFESYELEIIFRELFGL